MFTEKNDTLRQILTVAALAMTMIVNSFGGSGQINNISVGNASDQFLTFITPPGYVFAIWGVIYVGLISYALYQGMPAQKHNSTLRKIALPVILNCVFNTVWIFVWVYGFYNVSLVMMLGVLATLVMIYMTLGIGRNPTSTAMLWRVHIPFSIYLGWITVATVVNTTVVLMNAGWNGEPLPAPLWGAIMLVVASVVGALMAVRHGDIAYVLVFVWAFAGIIVKYTDTPIVMVTAIVMILALIGALVTGLPIRKKRFSLASA